jgi:hypothetical protein
VKLANDHVPGEAVGSSLGYGDRAAGLQGGMPDDFDDGFGRSASLAALLHVLSVIEATEPLDASQGLIHHLCVLAGTIGFPGLSDAPYRAESAVERSASRARQEAGSDKSAA